MLLKQTKIVATISDQRCDVDFIKQLFDAGLNVVRMNTAHAGREGFEKLIANVRTVPTASLSSWIRRVPKCVRLSLTSLFPSRQAIV